MSSSLMFSAKVFQVFQPIGGRCLIMIYSLVLTLFQYPKYSTGGMKNQYSFVAKKCNFVLFCERESSASDTLFFEKKEDAGR